MALEMSETIIQVLILDSAHRQNNGIVLAWFHLQFSVTLPSQVHAEFISILITRKGFFGPQN